MNIAPKQLAILDSAEIPALSGVAQELNELILQKQTSATEIAKVILKDAALTTKVLRVANSAIFAGSGEINSVNRAVVMLGNQGIKSIFISVMVVESLVKKPMIQERLMHCLGRAFFASVLAKNLVEARGQGAQEDVFVAALLQHLGEMLFWSSRHAEVKKAARRVSEGEAAEKVIEETMGVKVTELTKHYAERWQLSDVLQETLERPKNISNAARCVLAADAAAGILQSGWGKRDLSKVLNKSCELLRSDPEKAYQFIERSLEEASNLAEFYGAAQVKEFLEAECDELQNQLGPQVGTAAAQEKQSVSRIKTKSRPKQERAEPECEMAPDAASVSQAKSVPQESSQDSVIEGQLHFIDHLWDMFQSKRNVNSILRAMVEGLHQNLDFDRIGIALVNAERTEIKVRHKLGRSTETWVLNFKFDISENENNIFTRCIDLKEAIVLHSACSDYGDLMPPALNELLGYEGEFVVAPLFAGSKPLAIVYADCSEKRCQISAYQLESLKRLTSQAHAGFTLMINQ